MGARNVGYYKPIKGTNDAMKMFVSVLFDVIETESQ